MLIRSFPSGPLQTNGILIGCPKTYKGAIIDAPFGSSKAILSQAKEWRLTVEKILLTHTHWDHIADAKTLREQTGAPLYVHSLDAKNLEEPGSDGLPLYIPIEPVKPDFFFQGGEQVTLGTIPFEVIHTPGHCPGSVCFYFPTEKVLISGDTLFRGTYGALHLPTAEPKKMRSSLARLAKLPPETQVIPGHGPATSIGEESWLAQYVGTI